VFGAVNVFGGVVSAFWQELPATVNGELAVTVPNVTDPLPVMLTVTVSAALTAGDVPVGMPKDRETGETETVCASEY
jgi:hypothetical protein